MLTGSEQADRSPAQRRPDFCLVNAIDATSRRHCYATFPRRRTKPLARLHSRLRESTTGPALRRKRAVGDGARRSRRQPRRRPRPAGLDKRNRTGAAPPRRPGRVARIVRDVVEEPRVSWDQQSQPGELARCHWPKARSSVGAACSSLARTPVSWLWAVSCSVVATSATAEATPARA